MKSVQHVLAATDLSSPSLRAVDRGFLIASATGARCSVVHALDLDVLAPLRRCLGTGLPGLSGKIAAEARDELSRIAADPARNLGLTAVVQVETGPADTAVLRHAAAAPGAIAGRIIEQRGYFVVNGYGGYSGNRNEG